MKPLTNSNIYTALCVLGPVLYIYKSPIPGVDLGTFLVLLFAICILPSVRGVSLRMPWALGLVVLYIAINTMVLLGIGSVIQYSSEINIIMRTMRFVILMVVMIGVGFPTLFDFKRYVSFLNDVSLFVASYAIIQSIVFKLTGYKLMSVIKAGSLVSGLGENEFFYRPPSIFGEPSHVAYYLTPILCFLLFSHSLTLSENKRLWSAVIISIGMLVTTSGQGLLVLALCWGIWLLLKIRAANIKKVFPFLVAVSVLIFTYDFSRTLNRITTQDSMNAVDARSEGYLMVDQMDKSDLWFGMGFGNYDETCYYSSFAEIIFCMGYIGLALVVLMYLIYFLRGCTFQKVLVVSSFLLMFGGGIFTATSLCLYLPLLSANTNE